MEATSILGAMVYGPLAALYGKFDEITLPDVKNKIQENKPTDGIGARRIPSISIDPMEVTFKAAGFNPAFHALASNPFVEVGLQVRSNHMKARGMGRAQADPIKVEIRGWFSSAKIGSMKQGEGAPCEYKMEAAAIKLSVNGLDIEEIDVDNYIWRVGGADIIADFRANLGIS